MEDLQQNLEQNTNESGLIEVSKVQLATLLSQNKEHKKDIGEIIDIAKLVLWIISFFKNNLFGGKVPEKFDLGTLIKIGTKLPRIAEKMDEETQKKLVEAVEKIKEIAAKFLTAEEIEELSK